jgi:hypothetical protein
MMGPRPIIDQACKGYQKVAPNAIPKSWSRH